MELVLVAEESEERTFRCDESEGGFSHEGLVRDRWVQVGAGGAGRWVVLG